MSVEGGGGGRRVRGRNVLGERDSEWEGGTREPGFRYEASKLAQCVETCVCVVVSSLTVGPVEEFLRRIPEGRNAEVHELCVEK